MVYDAQGFDGMGEQKIKFSPVGQAPRPRGVGNWEKVPLKSK